MNRLALRPRDRIRMITPFAFVALLPLALAPLPPSGGAFMTAASGVLTLSVFLSIVLLPWEGMPLWGVSVPGLVS